jgi:hypothetical protein
LRREIVLQRAALAVGAIPLPSSFFIRDEFLLLSKNMDIIQTDFDIRKYWQPSLIGGLMHTRLMKAAVHC